MSSRFFKIQNRDLLGQSAVDYEQRIDMHRLKKERLARLRVQMKAADLGGMLLFDPINIRYAIGVQLPGAFYSRTYWHSVLVPQEGIPIYFGNRPHTAPMDGSVELRHPHWWEFFPCGRNMQEGARRWADDLAAVLKERHLDREQLGIDRLDIVALDALRARHERLADARRPLEMARAIKTVDELALIRQSCAVADVAISDLMASMKPGVTENELFATLAATNLRFGGEEMEWRALAAGGNTKPWGRGASDRLVRPGDFVAFDTDMAGPFHYMADISRTYLCGDSRPTQEQREAYKIAFEFLQGAIPLFKVGADIRDISKRVPTIPENYRADRYRWLAHGVGMSDEWPSIYFPDVSPSGFDNDPEVLEENMVICVESLASKDGGRESVKLEEQIIITNDGPEVISKAPFDWRVLA